MALSAEGQLSGKLTRHWDSEGLRVEMSIPMRTLSRTAKAYSVSRPAEAV
jgi:hypothetical protein